MALALLVVQQIIMIAGFALLAQFLVGIFAWGRREANPIYRFFRLVASPFVRVMRLVTPKFVPDQHVPVATFLFLSVMFLWVGLEQRDLCMRDLAASGCERWREARGAQ